jgi:hypothetical protein
MLWQADMADERAFLLVSKPSAQFPAAAASDDEDQKTQGEAAVILTTK